ncbi:hypothetical protein Tco_0941388 [Tanacetum coccineum]|uniref:Uncharacterized protein n=1 Tax=Tanacetum coccineum TaxID=301880 RepID=A0ABQ5DS95_9ASTR
MYVMSTTGFEDPDFPDRAIQAEEGWHICSQDKYVGKILKKFRFTEVKTASTPMETQKPLLKDEDGEEVVFLCRGKLDGKSTTGGCQFLRRRLISWQCKKQTVVANSTTEAEYVAASSCCGQFLNTCLGKAKKSVRLMMGKLFGNGFDVNYWYALTINPTIYISCIEQFWSTIMAKTINGEEQLHALVDGKKIIITESTVRRDLQLADEEDEDEVAIDAIPLAVKSTSIVG